jgi:hypothetical protein
MDSALVAWAEQQFGEADLGDQRRVDRAVAVAYAMAFSPGASLPQMFARWADVKAAYRLFSHSASTPDALQDGHRALVGEALASPGVYLLIEDTTEICYRGRATPVEGFGPVGGLTDTAQACGYLLHSVLAAQWLGARGGAGRLPLRLVGVADQQYHVRTPRPPGERRKQSRAHSTRPRESDLWERASARLGAAPDDEQVRWVRVCDAAADVYELLESCRALGHGHVIHCGTDRSVLCDGRRGLLYEVARAGAALGTMSVELSARPKRPARTAQLRVSARAVEVLSPRRPGQPQGVSRYACTVVRLWEPTPPEGVTEPVEWFLLCDGRRLGREQALECSQQYVARWVIEEFHKALKSGLGAERLQLETARALTAAVAVQSVVALRLIELRERVRLEPEAAASASGLSDLEMTVLERSTGRRLLTVRDVALAIGRLGGHPNRKSDGMPGWASLMRGMQKLLLFCTGARLARDPERSG